MKRLVRLNRLQQCQQRRRGALFHYYMMYLMLSSVLLTTAGLSIHAVLKSDRTDSVIARDLKSLLRLEAQLRNDARDISNIDCTAEQVILANDAAESTIRWTIDRNLARREVTVANKVHSSDRFVFVKGTQLAFTQTDQNVILTIRDPSAVPVTSDVDPPVAATAVQIVLWLSSTSADGEAS